MLIINRIIIRGELLLLFISCWEVVYLLQFNIIKSVKINLKQNDYLSTITKRLGIAITNFDVVSGL